MSEDFHQSVTGWIRDLKEGKPDAAGRLWEHFFGRLVAVAARKLGSAPRRVADEEDVAVSVFATLCRGAAEGRFAQLRSRDDLWKLLVALASQKAVDQIRRGLSKKRGGGRVRGDSVLGASDGDGPAGFEQFLASEPTPEFVAVVEEEQQRLLGLLREDNQRRIACLRLEGYSNEEIAERLGLSLRTVERKLNLVRQTWSGQIGA